jgi:hypothetical protein
MRGLAGAAEVCASTMRRNRRALNPAAGTRYPALRREPRAA